MEERLVSAATAHGDKEGNDAEIEVLKFMFLSAWKQLDTLGRKLCVTDIRRELKGTVAGLP